MITYLLSWWIERMIRRMAFPCQAKDGATVSTPVLQTFSRGCTMGLRGYAHDVFQKEAQSIPWHLRAFFHEGHAMGAAGRSACSLSKRNPELTMAFTDYRVMRFVGYGFWNGAAMAYHAPGLPDHDRYWREVPAYAKHRLLMANGLGFSTVLFAGKFDQGIKTRFLAQQDVEWQKALFHGVGRVLWFLYLNNFSALRDLLLEHADIAEPLGIGLGLAIAFTQVTTPDKIRQDIEVFEESDQWNLIRGAGIALQVHASNDPACKMHVERLLTGDLLNWYEAASEASLVAGEGSDWYPRYHELTKHFVGLATVVSE